MTDSMKVSGSTQVYRVEGFTCANCAGRFEQNVKQLPGVQDAKVNFGASKITVVGHATIEELERAGAFEQLKVRPDRPLTGDITDHEGVQEVTGGSGFIAFGRRHIILLMSVWLLVCGYVSHFVIGEHHVLTVTLFAASIVIGGFSLFRTGLNNLFRLEFDMRTLMTIAIIGAALIGEWAEGAVVVILFAISEAMERYSMDKARRSIGELMNLAPREALVVRDGMEKMMRVEEIEVGDLIIVKPGQKIAMDGIVTGGRSAVNQAAITGESIPVDKKPGDEVFAGTLNEEGLLEVKVTKLARDTTIAKIVHLVEEAQGERAPAQAFVDRFAKWYTPMIMIVAALVAIVPSLFTGDWGTQLYLGLSVLVVGCPCALVISTPITIVSAIGTAARHGVLVKGGIYLEQLGSLKAVALDKTGTLTRGKPIVTDYRLFGQGKEHSRSGAEKDSADRPADGISGNMGVSADVVNHFAAFGDKTHSKDHTASKISIAGDHVDADSDESRDSRRLLAILAALEQRSQHPLAAAFIQLAEEERWSYREIDLREFSSITGRGVQGTVDDIRYYAGSLNWFRQLSIELTEEQQHWIHQYQQEGQTVVLFGTEQGVRVIVAIADQPRETSGDTVRQLHQLGIQHTVLLTGDHEATARAIARQTGVTEVRAELMPQDKLTMVKQLQKQYGTVAMVGDGVNDAPALAAADVGIAMGGAGTDTALETADVALMGDDLGKLPFAIRLSRKALAVIRQNITLSLAMKAAALLLVIPGWLTLWIAILSDMGATLIVALNGMRLMRVKDLEVREMAEKDMGVKNAKGIDE